MRCRCRGLSGLLDGRDTLHQIEIGGNEAEEFQSLFFFLQLFFDRVLTRDLFETRADLRPTGSLDWNGAQRFEIANRADARQE
jgi:hypothetical protein